MTVLWLLSHHGQYLGCKDVDDTFNSWKALLFHLICFCSSSLNICLSVQSESQAESSVKNYINCPVMFTRQNKKPCTVPICCFYFYIGFCQTRKKERKKEIKRKKERKESRRTVRRAAHCFRGGGCECLCTCGRLCELWWRWGRKNRMHSPWGMCAAWWHACETHPSLPFLLCFLSSFLSLRSPLFAVPFVRDISHIGTREEMCRLR